MRIGFVVNDLEREKPRYATTLLALEALRRGHESGTCLWRRSRAGRTTG